MKMFRMDVIILTFSMPQFPDHGLELVERLPCLRQARKRSKSLASKYSQTKGRKREQLWSKYLTLSILHSELMFIEGVESNLHLTREELSDLTCIHLKFYHLSKAENQGK